MIANGDPDARSRVLRGAEDTIRKILDGKMAVRSNRDETAHCRHGCLYFVFMSMGVMGACVSRQIDRMNGSV